MFATWFSLYYSRATRPQVLHQAESLADVQGHLLRLEHPCAHKGQRQSSGDRGYLQRLIDQQGILLQEAEVCQLPGEIRSSGLHRQGG